jgi:hypothetical protein
MSTIILHQPGSQPLIIPEQVPNPAYAPKREEPNLPSPPSPQREPSRREPVKVPEKV